MSAQFKMRFGSVFICICIGWILTGCSLFDFPGDSSFTSHDIGIANRSSLDIYVDYIVENRTIDTTGNQTLVDYTLTDSSIVIQKNSAAILFERQFNDYQSYGLEYDHIESLITRLVIYQIQGNDTIVATPDLLDEKRWDYSNNDPLPFSDYHHRYLLLMTDDDFE